ncbi:uncharacterized protein LOC129960475 [Argiope bruennichi]|uniref:SOCS box domain-containing protein n=1 Tax=Argiope bruennichi TaxID=94029 RepID=A0A8T0FQQ5_ARGBR|nr:uncharacterized protein LOC129960475 [Argiope bruennichi]KAF8791053.1 hypothetical protein HNY73_005982 [Argiope bruennichi]
MNSKFYRNKELLSLNTQRTHEKLFNFSNIVKFSFIVQKSLIPLDLELCKYCLQRGENNKDTRSYFDPFPPRPKNIYISTEESCRKYFWDDRKILYKRNLDISNCFEQSLRANLPESALELYGTYFNKISISKTVDRCVLHSIKMHAYQNTDSKIKFIKLLLKLRKLQDPFIEKFCSKYGLEFLRDLRHKSNDSNLVKAVLNMIDFEAWMTDNQDPEFLEDLLFHIRRSECNLNEGIEYKKDFINDCTVKKKFLDVEPFLKYKDSPHFTSESYRHLKTKMRRHLMGQAVKKAEYYLGRKRSLLLLQILWSFYNRTQPSASVALRLIWDSVPDAYISLKEFVLIFAASLSPITINMIYSFYTKAICQRSESNTPRSLQHYCKIAIRRALGSKKLWLPDAIKQIGFPPKVEAFLNLERSI